MFHGRLLARLVVFVAARYGSELVPVEWRRGNLRPRRSQTLLTRGDRDRLHRRVVRFLVLQGDRPLTGM
jgi:hypothetical protein